MADPTLALSFDDFRARVAEYLGIAYYGSDGSAAAAKPTDTHDLDLVSRLVNDGYRRFMSESPQWNFLTVPLSLTFLSGEVDSDASRYYLPDDFYGIVTQPFTYTDSTVPTEIKLVDEGFIRSLQQSGSSSGNPCYLAVRPLDAATDGKRWEALVWPTPSAAKTIKAMYRRFPNQLSSDTDRSVAGFQHDNAVLAACLAAAELHGGESPGAREMAYQAALARSRAIDARSAPPIVRDFGDGSTRRLSRSSRVYKYNGVSVG